MTQEQSNLLNLDLIELPASLSNAINDSQIRTSPIEATVNSVAEIEQLVSPDAISVIPDEILLPSPFPPPFNIILGTENNDFLVGSLGANDTFNDLIIGFGGNDIILGLEGEDTILGGTGNDLLYGGPESAFSSPVILPFFGDDDLLFGEDGHDRFIGGRGNDLFNGGSGTDKADYTDLGQAITLKAQGVIDKGSLGQDQIIDIETILGAKGQRNSIDGSDDNGITSFDINLSQKRLVVQDIPRLGDVQFKVRRFLDVTGTNQNDQIVGSNRRNILIGRGGNDHLSGLGGKDTINGVDPFSIRPGFNEIDYLSGGAGKDTFVIGDNQNNYYLGGGFFGLNDFAYIKDFQSGLDKIQLKKGKNYIFGNNFIAIGNPFDFRTLETFDSLIKGLDADGVLNMGASLPSTVGNSALSLDGTTNAESLTILPNFDLVAIVNTSYSQQDLVFV